MSVEIIENYPDLRPFHFIRSMNYEQFRPYSLRWDNEKDRKDLFKRIHKMCDEVIRAKGNIHRIYNHSLATPSGIGGRLFGSTSIQFVPREIRGLLMKHTTDIDMKNAHPTILLYLCKKYNIKCLELEYYVNHRDEIIGNGTDREAKKEMYLKALNKDKVVPEIKEFSKEIIKIQKQIMTIDEFRKIDDTMDNKKWNKSGSFVNKCLCIYEDKILSVVRSYLNSNNYIIRCLAFDGLMIDGNHYDNTELLREIENTVNTEFEGLNMVFAYKPHDNSIVIPDEFVIPAENEIPEEDLKNKCVWTDKEASQRVFELYPNWKFCKNCLFVFNDETGMWCNNETDYFKLISRFEGNLHQYIWDEKKKQHTQGKKSYGNDLYLMKKIVPFLNTLCVDENWLREKESSSMGKLLFPNGVLDLRDRKFYHKDEYPFNPEFVFSYRMPQDFIYDDIDYDYEESIKQRLFYNPLGEEVGNYLILQFARALAGDLAKQITFGIGFGNNGKSVISDAVKNSCGDYFGGFDAEDFTHNQNSSRDGGQKMRPFYLNRNKRILISNELGGGSVVNGDMVKKNSSGGDVLKGRLHGGNETEFTPQYMVFVFSNEFPKFHKIDEATYNRIRVIDFKRKFVDNPVDDDEIQKDENIINEIKNVKFRTHFVAMLLSTYFDFLEEGRKEIIPDSVICARNEWVGTSGEFNIIGNFLESYEITNNPDDFVSSNYIKSWLDIHSKGTSMEKFAKQLKAYCSKKFGSDCAISNKVKKKSGKAQMCWFGMKEIGYDDDNDEITECLI